MLKPKLSNAVELEFDPVPESEAARVKYAMALISRGLAVYGTTVHRQRELPTKKVLTDNTFDGFNFQGFNKGSYIFVEHKDKKKLYYIGDNGSTQTVKINSIATFTEKLNIIEARNRSKDLEIDYYSVKLNRNELNELITLNGGHAPNSKHLTFTLDGPPAILPYLWTAAMIFGSDSVVKFDHKVLKLSFNSTFNFKAELGWFSRFSKTSLYERVFKHHITPDMLIISDSAPLYEDVLVQGDIKAQHTAMENRLREQHQHIEEQKRLEKDVERQKFREQQNQLKRQQEEAQRLQEERKDPEKKRQDEEKQLKIKEKKDALIKKIEEEKRFENIRKKSRGFFGHCNLPVEKAILLNKIKAYFDQGVNVNFQYAPDYLDSFNEYHVDNGGCYIYFKQAWPSKYELQAMIGNYLLINNKIFEITQKDYTTTDSDGDSIAKTTTTAVCVNIKDQDLFEKNLARIRDENINTNLLDKAGRDALALLTKGKASQSMSKIPFSWLYSLPSDNNLDELYRYRESYILANEKLYYINEKMEIEPLSFGVNFKILSDDFYSKGGHVSDYKNSYVYYTKEKILYFVNSRGISKIIKIDDIQFFEKKLNKIKNSQKYPIVISEQKIAKMIALNGEYEPPIHPYNLFLEQLGIVRSWQKDTMGLTKSQIQELILSNIEYDKKQRENFGDTALIAALKNNNDALADYLLRSGADPFIKNNVGISAASLIPSFSPLYELIKQKEEKAFLESEQPESVLNQKFHEEMNKFPPSMRKINEWLKKGANINYQSEEDGYTALMMAIDTSNEQLAENLLKKLADPFLQNADGDTASDLASRNSFIYTLLKSYELIYATSHHDLLKVKILIRQGANIECRHVSGYTPLLIAVEQNDYDLVEFLVAQSADLTVTRDDGQGVFDLCTDDDIRALLYAANNKVGSNIIDIGTEEDDNNFSNSTDYGSNFFSTTKRM